MIDHAQAANELIQKLRDLPANAFAICQIKTGSEYHLLRFSSLKQLQRDALRFRERMHNETVQAEAASRMTLVDGCNLDDCAKAWGLNGYFDLPLTREDVWKLIIGSQYGSEALAEDIVFNLRRGKYSKGFADRDRNTMIRAGLPKWFPEYASVVMYLFPKAHCIEFAWHDIVREWTEKNDIYFDSQRILV